MTKSQTKKALLMSLLSMLLCCTMLIGTTFAWFTDSVESGVNQIVAGNLDVELYNDVKINPEAKVDGMTTLFKPEKGLWEPGVVMYENFTVANEGNLALKYIFGLNVEEGAPLAQALKVGVVDGGIAAAEGETLTREAVLAMVATDSWKAMESFELPGQLLAEKTATFGIVIWWEPTAADNNFNMNNENREANKVLSIDLGVTLVATQLENESDSFGNDYDKDANYTVTADSVASLIEAINEGKNIILAADIELSNTVVVADGQKTTIDLNGHAITTATAGTSAFENYGTLTIIDSVGGGSITARIGVNNYGTLVLNGGTIVANEQGGAAIYNNAGSDANFTMNGGTLKVTFVGSYVDSTGGACIRNTGDSVTTITGGTLESRSARAYAIISNGTLNITPAAGKNVTMTAYRGIAIDDGTANINGGTFTVLDANEEEGKHVAAETYYALYIGGNDSIVTVNGGTFTAPDSSVWRPDWDEAATDLVINGGTFNGSLIGNAGYYPSKHIVVNGGNFKEDPSDYVADGCKAIDNGDGTYTVKQLFAINGDTVTLLDPNAFNDALAEVQNGGTLVLPEGKFDAFAAEGMNVKLVGAVDENDNPATTIYNNTLPGNDGNGVWEYADKVEFVNIIFEAAEGIEDGSTAPYQSALNIENGMEAVFTNCKFVNQGLHISGNSIFKKCVFEGNKNGYKGIFLAPAEDCTVVIDECEFSGYTFNSINVQEASNSTLTIKNSTISGAMVEVGALKALTFENTTLNCDVVAWFTATSVTIPEDSFGKGFGYTNLGY